MSESTIRRMVRSAYEQEATDAGLFSDERIRNFFAMVKSLANDCFQSLYDTVMREYAHYTPEERTQRFERGLAFIANENNYKLSTDEVARATQEFPTIQHEYERAMVKFAQIMVSHKDPSLKIEVPSFATFLMRFYNRIASHRIVKSMRYFTMAYFEQDIFLKDMLRINMNACLNMRVVQRREDEGGRPRSRVGQGSGGGSSILHAALQSTREPPSSTNSSQVLPSDSVSNISYTPPARTRSKRGGGGEDTLSQLSEVSERSDDAGSQIQQSDFSLRKYKQHLVNSKKEKTDVLIKPFRPSSIVKTKEVDLQPPPSAQNGGEEEEEEEDDDPQPAGSASDIAGYSTLSR